MKLYENNDAYFEILNTLQSTDDKETIQKLYADLDGLDEHFEQKSENIGKVLQQLKADESTLKDEIKRLQARKKTLENNYNSLKSYLYSSMKSRNVENIKTPLFTFNIQNNPMSVNVLNENEIPKEFFVEQSPKLSKKELLEHIKDTGEIIPGVEIQQTEDVRIR